MRGYRNKYVKVEQSAMRGGKLVNGLSEFEGGFLGKRRAFGAISRSIGVDEGCPESNKSTWEQG